MTKSELSDNDLVWYVAYGSNLLRERFLAYLGGGSGPGGSGSHVGARDATPPRADRTFALDRQLVFTGRSQRWDGGGVCAVVPAPPAGGFGDAGSCLGRGWLITVGQLFDVWRQENGGRDPGPVPWSTFPATGHHDVDDGRYRRLDWLGRLDGLPAVTITCGQEMQAERNPPTLDYLVTVGRGLTESWGLAPDNAANYLLQATSRSAVPAAGANGAEEAGAAGAIQRALLVDALGGASEVSSWPPAGSGPV